MRRREAERVHDRGFQGHGEAGRVAVAHPHPARGLRGRGEVSGGSDG